MRNKIHQKHLIKRSSAIHVWLTIRKDDLKVKDYNKYQAYYCGLCQDIKEAYGKKGQAMLTFDMTFLSILLTGLYECETKEEEHYCFLHPGKKT